jgi:hypothetical protein
VHCSDIICLAGGLGQHVGPAAKLKILVFKYLTCLDWKLNQELFAKKLFFPVMYGTSFIYGRKTGKQAAGSQATGRQTDRRQIDRIAFCLVHFCGHFVIYIV